MPAHPGRPGAGRRHRRSDDRRRHRRLRRRRARIVEAEELARPLVAAGASVGASSPWPPCCSRPLVEPAAGAGRAGAAAWAHLEVDLQRRADTIRGLVEVVRAATAHEAHALEAAAQGRSTSPAEIPAAAVGGGIEAGSTSGGSPTTGARVELAVALRRGVPDAARVTSTDVEVAAGGASERELLAVEDRIAAGRRFYNDADLPSATAATA